MDGHPQVRSAADVVRCFYLARIAEREGHLAAAQRLYAQVAPWIRRHFPGVKAASVHGETGCTAQGKTAPIP